MLASPQRNLIRRPGKKMNVLRRFTERRASSRNITYEEQFDAINVMSLEKRRLCADLILIFICMHGQSGCLLEDIRLSLNEGCTRGAYQSQYRTSKAGYLYIGWLNSGTHYLLL